MVCKRNKAAAALLAGVLISPAVSRAQPLAPASQNGAKAQLAPVKNPVYGRLLEAVFPSPAWAAEPGFSSVKSVEICIKKASGSLIVVRRGAHDLFGMPEEGSNNLGLDEPEMAWLVKLLPKGDYQGELKLHVANAYLSRAHTFGFLVKYQAKDCINLVVLLKDAAKKDLMVIDFLANQANYEADRADFFSFLESLKEKGKKIEMAL